jgi:hypothetical protein
MSPRRNPRACSVGHSAFERLRLVRAYYVCRTNLAPSRYDVGCDFQMFTRSCWMLRSGESLFRAFSSFDAVAAPVESKRIL